MDGACNMQEEMHKKALFLRQEGKRPLGAPKHICEDNIKMHLDGYGRVAKSNEHGSKV